MKAQTPLTWTLALAAFLNLGACVDYEARSDLVVASGGDAVAANRVRQIIDPWPKTSFAKTQTTVGARVGPALERYKSGGSVAPPEPVGSGSSKTTN